MATGMVLIIVSRNIDLSVGSLLGFLGYTMALVQTDGMIAFFGLDVTIGGLRNSSYAWLVALAVGVVLGALVGGLTGFIVAYGGVPSFIVTLGGFLVWRGAIFRTGGKQGQTLVPARRDVPAHRRRSERERSASGGAGCSPSWAVPGSCSASTCRAGAGSATRLAVRPMWVDVGLGVVGCAAVVAGVALIANRYDSPVTGKPLGVAYPVVILIGVTLVMTYLARRRRFGRYVYAYGGNPEAAELSGINTRRTVMLTFVLMGVLVAVSAAIQTARLNSAVTNLGVQNELDVIAAAVIGGTSFSGGIGTVPGAVLGAVIMQSLRSGMVLLNIDSPSQDVVVGVVLVAAVAVDAALRSGRRRAAVAALVAGLIVAAIVIQTGQPYERRRAPSSTGGSTSDRRTATVAAGGRARSWRCGTSAWPSAASTPSTVSAWTSTRVRWSPSSAGNGAGKSTLMHTLSGAHPADSGQILINGEPVTIHVPRDAQKHGIETIYQKLALADNIDAAGNVFLGREMRTRTGALDDSAMASATREVMRRLNPRFTNLKTPVKSLSGGQRQAVAIARAIHFNAKILIMDEPTAALGPAETGQVHELVAQLKSEGIGIFLISHDIHDVFDLADRISVMLTGKLVGTVDKNDVTKDEVLAMIIMGKQPDEVSERELAEFHG